MLCIRIIGYRHPDITIITLYCKAINIGVLFKLDNLVELKKGQIKYPPKYKIIYKMRTDSMKMPNYMAAKIV